MFDLRATFERDGYAVIDHLLEIDAVNALKKLADPLLTRAERARPGVRRVLEREPRFLAIMRATPVPPLLRSLTSGEPRIIRSILFDKSPEANWMVPWHQDAVIAVREKREAEGFGPWSIKDDEPHCRPPRHILDDIGVLRFSLDDCGPDNGPLRVIPGSHSHGIVTAAHLEQLVAHGPAIECCTPAGGAVLMRPHTIHASPRSTRPYRRRILHLEFTDARLPSSLEWAESTIL